MALTLLREAIALNRPHRMDVASVFLNTNQHTLDRKLRTSYRSKKGEYCTLESIYTLLVNELSYSDYVSYCIKQQIEVIDFISQKPLLQFLRSEKANNAFVDVAYEQQQLQELQWTIDNILAEEQTIASRHTVTQCTVPYAGSVIAVPSVTEGGATATAAAAAAAASGTTTANAAVVKRSVNKSLYAVLSIYDAAIQLEKPTHDKHAIEEDTPTKSSSSSSSSNSSNSKPSASSSSHIDKRQKTAAVTVKAPASTAPLTAEQQLLLIPIIIVPAGASSALTIYNALDFLQNGVFRLSSEAKQQQQEAAAAAVAKAAAAGLTDAAAAAIAAGIKPLSVRCFCPSVLDHSKQVEYLIIDDPVRQLTTAADWARVVCVFVSGPQWQFSAWPAAVVGATPAAIFSAIAAFHLHFDGEELHANIKLWATHKLNVSRSKRYNDRSKALEFWGKLGQWVVPRNATKQLRI